MASVRRKGSGDPLAAFCSPARFYISSLASSRADISQCRTKSARAIPRWSASAQPPQQAEISDEPGPTTRNAAGIASRLVPIEAELAAIATEAQLRRRLARRRLIRRSGLILSTAMLTSSAGALAMQHEASLPPPSAVLAAFAALASAMAALRVELGRDGVLYVSKRWPVLRTFEPLDEAVSVRETGDGRGRGAYATQVIPLNTSLGEYGGEFLDNARFLTLYPIDAGVYSEYVMAVDAEWVRDARAVAVRSGFTPGHMNHSADPAKVNVGRVYARRLRKVVFYTTRDVAAGEELVFDYGRAYWRGREEMEVR